DAGRRDPRAQLPGGAGRRAGRRGDLRRGQPGGRSVVRAGRPEDPAGMTRASGRPLSPSAWLGLAVLAGGRGARAPRALVARYDLPLAHVELAHQFEPSSAAHWLGTDASGRDTLSQLLWGARSALQLSIIVVAISSLLGLAIGTAAGWFGGAVDEVV